MEGPDLTALLGGLAFGFASFLAVIRWAPDRPFSNLGPAALAFSPWLQRRRLRAMEKALPGGLSALAGSVRAGASLQQALLSLSREGPEPLKSECFRMLEAQASGRDLDHELGLLARRYDLEELNLAVAGIRMSRRSGTDLAAILDEASELTRSKAEMDQKVRALAAQGLLSAWVMVLLPPALLSLIAMLDPAFVEPLFGSDKGRALLVLALAWELIGAFWVSRILKAARA